MTYTVQNTIKTKQRQELEYREEPFHAVPYRARIKSVGPSFQPRSRWRVHTVIVCLADKKIRGNKRELKKKYFGRERGMDARF